MCNENAEKTLSVTKPLSAARTQLLLNSCFLLSLEFSNQLNTYILEVKIVFIYFFKLTLKLTNKVFANSIQTEILTVSVIVSQ